ncbi:hypothetical protein D3C84_847010 [compost metagenome]
MRVAIAVEQAFFSGDQGAFAVDVNRAAFQHEAFGVVAIAPLDFQHFAGQLFITVPRRVQAAVEAAPGIEAPVDAAYVTAVVDDEGRPGVAHPGIVVADFHHTNVGGVQACARVVVLGRGNRHRHRLETGDSLGQGYVRGLYGLATQAPVVRALWPDHPDLCLWRPFGGHVKTVGAGSAGQRSHE